MELKRKTVKGVTTLSLSGELTIYNVAQCYALLFENDEKIIDHVALDLSAVSELDTAGVQLLLFTKKTFSDVHKTFFVTKSNELVDRIFAMLNVAFIFAKDSKV